MYERVVWTRCSVSSMGPAYTWILVVLMSSRTLRTVELLLLLFTAHERKCSTTAGVLGPAGTRMRRENMGCEDMWGRRVLRACLN